ncbi:sugar transferase [Streptococcus plurextorum]|uniref:sugar transferase n=1 Tax=Streptococcus plurextorum TaxID=456876 RepID=UPI000401DFBD|nr:sugar transferase [Streptococcus plurextorum]
MEREREEWQKLAMLFIDILPALISVYIVTQIPQSDLTFSNFPIIILGHFISFSLSALHRTFDKRGYLEEVYATLKYSLTLFVTIVTLSFILKHDFILSRRGALYFILLDYGLLLLTNLLLKKYRSSFSVSDAARKIYLVTTVNRFERFLAHPDHDLTQFFGTVAAVTFIDDPDYLRDDYFHNVPIHLMESYITKSVVDHLLIDVPSEMLDAKRLLALSESVGIPASININSIDSNIIGEKKFQTLLGYEVITISSHFKKYSHLVLKRLLDILGALVGLFICGLVGLFVVPLIRKDGGPAIFAQDRVGKNGRIFKFYKFRSMHINAEEMKKELMAKNEMDGLMFKMDDDPRITPIGKFIRKTSIDELPQFWNVLIGDMSLVGTRPPTVDEYNQYTLAQKRRLSFQPGITGLWQVSGRSDIKDFDEIVKLDTEYINNWTIWSDIKILVKTVFVVFKMKGSK